MEAKTEKFSEWAIVEMMGHRKVAAHVGDSEIGGSSLLRLDVLGSDGEIERTEYIGVGSIYCLTIVTEETAKVVAKNNSPRPAWAYSPAARALPSGINRDFIDAGDEDENPY